MRWHALQARAETFPSGRTSKPACERAAANPARAWGVGVVSALPSPENAVKSTCSEVRSRLRSNCGARPRSARSLRLLHLHPRPLGDRRDRLAAGAAVDGRPEPLGAGLLPLPAPHTRGGPLPLRPEL